MAQQNLSQSDIKFLNDLLIEAGDIAVDLQESACNGQIKVNMNNDTSTVDEKISSLLVGRLKSRFPRHTILLKKTYQTNLPSVMNMPG